MFTEMSSGAWTCWPEASRVRAIASLVSAVAGQTTATSGLRWRVLFARLSPHGSWLRMSQECALWTEESYLPTFSETWPTWGIAWDGSAWRLPRWERRIAVSGCSSWPTPRVAADRASRASLTRDGHWSAPALGQAVELSAGVLPREFATIDELNATARAFWPTPRAEYDSGKHRGTADTLPGDLMRTGATGKLNPDWVCQLMGFPRDWLDVEYKPEKKPRKRSK